MPSPSTPAVLLAFAFTLAFAIPAAAHEAAPKRGGTVRTVNDLQYELVARGNDAVLYIDDHGKPVPAAGMSGTLTVLAGRESTDHALIAAGENRLEAKGARLRPGAIAVAVLRREGGRAVTVRFTLR